MNQPFSRVAMNFMPALSLITLILVGCAAPRAEETPVPPATAAPTVEDISEVTPTPSPPPPTVEATTRPTATSAPPSTATTEVSPTPSPVVTPLAPTPMPAPPLPVSQEVTFTEVAQLGGTANAVALDRPIVYLGLGPRLVTLDISDRAAPRFLWQSDVLPGLVLAVAVQDGLAYVVSGGDFHIYEVSDPANPVNVGTLADFAGTQAPGWITADLIPAGNIVYAMSRRYDASGLVALDVSDPSQPAVVGTRNLSTGAGVAAGNGVLYIADEGRLQLVDETNPATTLSEVELSEIDPRGGDSYGVKVTEDIAYIVANPGNAAASDHDPLLVLDVSDPAQPVEVVTIEIDISPDLSELAVTADALFLVSSFECNYASLYVIDISDVASPRYAAEFDPQVCIHDVAVDEDAGSILVAATSSGLRIFDTSDPANPTLAGEWSHPTGLNDVDKIAVNQNIAYITTGRPNGVLTLLRMLDLTQPAAPVLTGDALVMGERRIPGESFSISFDVTRLYVRGSRLFTELQANGFPTLGIVDISQPTSPRLIDEEGVYITFLPALAGNTLYAGNFGSLDILDMSDPANPTVNSTISTDGYDVIEMTAVGSYLITLGDSFTTSEEEIIYSWRLQIYDVSDPFQPVELGQIALPGPVSGFTVVGDALYYVHRVDNSVNPCCELYVVDISDPAHPVEAGRFAVSFAPYDMVPAGNILYLSGGEGTSALNVSDPLHPYLAGHLPDHTSISVVDDLLYAAGGRAGLFIISPSVSGTCRNDSEFVLDVNVPDGTHFAPGASFTKSWRIRNSGSCTWDSSYHLDFVSGERMNGPEHMPLGETVPPGGEVDVSIDLIAPQANGTYRGEWQLSAADGTPFGAKPYLEIVVP